MNDCALERYADGIDETVIEKYLRYEEKIKTHAKFFSFRNLKIVAVACVCAIIASVTTIGIINNIPDYVGFDELTAIGYVEGTPSLAGVLSPYPSGATTHQLSDEQLKMLFQKDVRDMFAVKPKDVKGEIICYPDGTVHTVSVTWIFEDGYLMTVIDPKEFPRFIFDDLEEETINGYDVGVIYYSDVVTNGEFVKDNVSIGMKKGDMGVLIVAPANCEKRAEEVFNYMLNFELDLIPDNSEQITRGRGRN